MATSSAKSEYLTCSFAVSHMSLIMMRNSVGDSTLPCGRPWSCGVTGESVVPHRTWKVRSVSQVVDDEVGDVAS